jgi:two-component system chemotaxis response regulator CheY
MGIEKHLSKRILVADDLGNMRLDLRKILTTMGFDNITEAADGKVAWDLARVQAQYGNPYELIFSDINMPQMNGIMFLNNVRSMVSYKNTPIYMISTENEKDIIMKAILAGATDYIIKPYNATVIKEKLSLKLN